MTPWLIIGGLILGLPFAAFGIWAWRTRDKAPSARHAAPPNFRTEGATRVTLPQRLEVHRDVRAAAWDRPHLWPDLPPAAPYRPDRLAVMAAEYEPPTDLPGDDVRLTKRIAGVTSVPAVVAGELALPASAAPGPVSGGGELAPHVIRALTRAGSEDTIVTGHDLEYIVGGDVYDGLGQQEWLDRLFTAPKPITWSAA